MAIQWVCGALYRELMLADSVRTAVQAGESEKSVFGRLRIWQARQAPMRQALSRLSRQAFDDAFIALAFIDRQSKGRADGDPWHTLDRLLCFLCDPSTAQPPLEKW